MMETAAETYDKLQFSRQGRDGMELIDKLPLKEGMKVLDIGCGTGFLASVIAGQVGESGKVTAVDPDAERVKFAQGKYSTWKNLQFFEKGSEDFPCGPYDVVFSNYVLHHIKNKAPTFRRVFEHLKEGGYFAFACNLSVSPKIWEIVKPRVDQDEYICPSSKYESLAKEHGFKIEHKSVDEVVYSFENVDQFIEAVLSSVHTNSGRTDHSTLENFKTSFSQKTVAVHGTRVMFILRK